MKKKMGVMVCIFIATVVVAIFHHTLKMNFFNPKEEADIFQKISPMEALEDNLFHKVLLLPY